MYEPISMDYTEFIEEWRGEKPYITAHSSGSTGLPKEIRLDKDFVAESAMRTNRFFGIGAASRLHSCVSPDFIGGKMMTVRSELSGATLTHETPSNQPLSEYLRSEREAQQPITLLAIVPSQMLYLLEHPGELPRIDNIIIGGSPVNPGLRKRIIESGLHAYETYGMTETASHIALRRIAAGIDYFETLDDITVGSDSRGCLVITIPTSSAAIPASSADIAQDVNGQAIVITTNDIAEVVSNRKFRILGRYDNVIITGGKKVNPVDTERQIEEAAMHDSDLRDALGTAFIITGTPDEKWGQAVTLRIETPNLSPVLSDEQLIQKLKDFLPPYTAPKRIERVGHLERTTNGKLKRGSNNHL